VQITLPQLETILNAPEAKMNLYNRLREVSEDTGGHYNDEEKGKALFAIYLLAETNKIKLLDILLPGATQTTESSLKTEFLNAAALLYNTAEQERQREMQRFFLSI